jgi:hypothetical protein
VVSVKWPTRTILICNVYAPQASAGVQDFFESISTRIAALVELHTPGLTVIAGDFNAHLFRPRLPFDKEFVNMVLNLRQEGYMVYPDPELPSTYSSGKSASTIDYVFVRGARVNSFEVGKIYVAQHRPLLFAVDLTLQPEEQQTLALGTAYWRSKEKQRNFETSLSMLGHVTSASMPSLLQNYYDRFDNTLAISTKRRPRRAAAESWEQFLEQDERERLCHARDKLEHLMFRADSGDQNARPDAIQAKKDLETLTTTLMRVAVERETDKLAASATSHTETWRLLAKLRGSGSQCPIPTAKLLEHFSAIAKPKESALLPHPLQNVQPAQETSDFVPLEPEELREALAEVNCSSAAGPDDIPPRLMCEAFRDSQAFEFLFNLMAMCLLLAYVPMQWREAVMFVLYKGSGDPCDANNHRAIALTSCFGKLCERLLLRRLLWWLKNSRLWMLPQFGFRKGSSCLHAIFLLRTLTTDILHSTGRPVFVAFVDLRKAFPSLGRDALFRRMLSLGIPYPLVAAVQSFYLANVARLRVDDTVTRDFFVAVGVLEGSVLSPCLFGILFSVVWDLFVTSDFPTPNLRLYKCNDLWLIAYADDLVVVTLCQAKLSEVLNKMAKELKTLNLQMRFDAYPLHTSLFYVLSLGKTFFFVTLLCMCACVVSVCVLVLGPLLSLIKSPEGCYCMVIFQVLS